MSAPSAAVVAETVRSCPRTVSVAGTCARFVTFARVSATAAPMVAVAPWEAEPLALDVASVFAALASVTAPPAVIEVTAGVTIVSASTVASVMPTAAATLTLPWDVEALGVVAEPVPDPPLAVEESSAKVRWSATC